MRGTPEASEYRLSQGKGEGKCLRPRWKMERKDRKKYLSNLLGQAVCTTLEDLDNLLVMRGVLRKANFKLPKKLATLLKSLLLLKLLE